MRSSPSSRPSPGEELDADIVEMGAAMDARLDVGLGDDERLRALEEGADSPASSRTSSLPRRRTRTAGSRSRPRPVPSTGSAAVSPAGKRYSRKPRKVKLSASHPFQEGDRLVDLVGRKRRRVRPVVSAISSATRARMSRPVAHRDGNVGVDVAQGLGRRRSRAPAASSMRSRWIWMKLSRRACGRVAAVASPQEPDERPGPSRSAARIGCATRIGS